MSEVERSLVSLAMALVQWISARSGVDVPHLIVLALFILVIRILARGRS